MLLGFKRLPLFEMEPISTALLALLLVPATSMFSESFMETTSSFSFMSRSDKRGYPLAASPRFDSLLSALLRLPVLLESIYSRCMWDEMIRLKRF